MDIFKVLRLLSAPWLHLAYRFIRSNKLLKMGLKADPLYLRNIKAKMEIDRRDFYVFNQLVTANLLIGAANGKADKITKSLLSKSEAQLIQDIVCLLIHNIKKEGYFVEVGVGDGKGISNTYILEKEYGWTGILVEPNKGSHESIKSQRNCNVDVRAATSENGQKLEFEENLDEGEYSKLVKAKSGHKNVQSGNKRSYLVETATLDRILYENGAPLRIDFISIDTEGTELDVLYGLDFERVKVDFFAIEHNHRSQDLKALINFLKPRGYHHILPNVSQWDAWFVHERVDSEYLSV